MNQGKILKIIIIVAIIIDLFIFVSLLYSNWKLRQDISHLEYTNQEIQTQMSQQSENISNLESKIETIESQEEIKSDPYYEAIQKLDSKVFLTNFDDYKVNSNEIKISESEAKEIAQKGFDESKSRIAGEGVDDIESETIQMEEISANNYFTRYYYQKDETYDNIKRMCYAIQRQNDMGCGVTVYVDATTGLIIAGRAFGD